MMKAWKIVLRGQVVDTVFYDAAITAETVERQLIDKDGFDPEIEVTPSRIHLWADDHSTCYEDNNGDLRRFESDEKNDDLDLGLVDQVIDQIKKDVEKGDLTALEALLCRVPHVDLQAFLSECW